MCGIIGLVLADKRKCVNQALVDALTILQHRGQDAAGIVTIKDDRLNLRKGTGTVAEVFTQDSAMDLQGNMGIGHVRYPTAGGGCSAEAQPLYVNSPFGLAIAHNGNLTNTDEMIASMRQEYRHINTDSDSELLLNVFAEELQRRLRVQELKADDIFDTVRSVMRRCKGGYAVVLLINRVGLVAFRDPCGIRPLCFGKRAAGEEGVYDYAVASESVAIDALDPLFRLERDMGAGEALFVPINGGAVVTQVVHPNPILSPCLFEFVYFARPDSVMDGVQVYEARSRMGARLANKILHQWGADHDIDIVMPIPETSRTSALSAAAVLKRPYREGFVKNRYIARTFIMPGQEMRRKTVRLKLNTIKSEFKDKVVLLVDDSIVRGTTSIELVMLAREAGAKKVYFASAGPAVRHTNVYGIDIPTRSELIAFGRNEEEIAVVLGADKVIYNDLADVEDSIRSVNPAISRFESSCFDGVYITDEVTEKYLDEVETKRGVSGKVSSKGGAGPGSSDLPPPSPGRVNSVDSLAGMCEGIHNGRKAGL